MRTRRPTRVRRLRRKREVRTALVKLPEAAGEGVSRAGVLRLGRALVLPVLAHDDIPLENSYGPSSLTMT